MTTRKERYSKHPLEYLGTTVIIITLIAGYLVGGAWGVKALMDAGQVVWAFLALLVLLVFGGAILAGAGTTIRERNLVRKDLP